VPSRAFKTQQVVLGRIKWGERLCFESGDVHASHNSIARPSLLLLSMAGFIRKPHLQCDISIRDLADPGLLARYCLLCVFLRVVLVPIVFLEAIFLEILDLREQLIVTPFEVFFCASSLCSC